MIEEIPDVATVQCPDCLKWYHPKLGHECEEML